MPMIRRSRCRPRTAWPQSIILPDPTIETTVPSGVTEMIVVIRDLERRGGIGFPYRIVAEPLTSRLRDRGQRDRVSVPRGGTAAIGVTIKRKGYNGPITVTVDDPPAGLTVRPGTDRRRPGGRSADPLRRRGRPRSPRPPIRLVGRGQGTSGPIERVAAEARRLRQANEPADELGHRVRPGRGPGTCRLPSTLDVPAAPIEVAQGFGATIPVKVVRDKGADAALAITGSGLAPGRDDPRGRDRVPRRTRARSASRPRSRRPWARRRSPSRPRASSPAPIGPSSLPAVTLSVVRPALARARRAGRRGEGRDDRRRSRGGSSAKAPSTSR